MNAEATRTFEAERAHLFGVAYRMLGSVAEAEDVVQDAYLRWHAAARDEVHDARAFLVTITTRLCLDRLGAARARREVYVGPWLPEPLVLDEAASPEVAAALAHDLSVALLVTLERLSPLERAAFLLHDVFDQDYPAVAAALGRSEAACRQLTARAREHVRDGDRDRAQAPRDTAGEHRLMAAFALAARDGDVDALRAVLAEDVVLLSDGGGKRLAALNPIEGRERVLRFIVGVVSKRAAQGDEVRFATINGDLGMLVREASGDLMVVSLAHGPAGITGVFIVRNPDKLGHVRWPG